MRKSLKIAVACLCLSGAIFAQQTLPDAPQPKPQLPSSGSALPNTAPLPAQAGVQPQEPTPPAPDTPGNQVPISPQRNLANQEQLENTFRLNVNLKMLPVTVRDESGKLVQDLQQPDFSVVENGTRQQIKYFSSDPFPLAAAIVIDTGLPNPTLEKVKSTLRAVSGAFGPYDTVCVFSYGNSVARQSDFTSVNSPRFSAAIDQVQKLRGQDNGGVPVTSGPLSPGLKVNNHPVDPTTSASGTMINSPPVNTRVSRVMNDALFAAAQALAKQDRTKRRVIIIVSDGQEFNSRNSYSDVLKVLLNDEITVDAIAIDAAAVPFINKIEQIHLPRQGYGNLLPKYTNATEGTLYKELSATDISNAYARATFDARNQYTIGYTPKSAGVSNEYREIDVRVRRPGLHVYAPAGYYSLPPKP